MGGLMIDFVLRLFGGGSICPLGALAQTVTAVMELFGSKPRWVAGPPKQVGVRLVSGCRAQGSPEYSIDDVL